MINLIIQTRHLEEENRYGKITPQRVGINNGIANQSSNQ